jgi:RNA polymerase sigma factor (sigma-70 family)
MNVSKTRTYDVENHEWLAEQFEENRARLRAVALRMLGSQGEADDAVQEAWLKLSRADTSSVDNLPGWLTTVVARVCLDMLRARQSRREDSLEDHTLTAGDTIDPEQEAILGDSVGLAMLVVLETLNPDERLAFVLHDMFGVSFEEIAPIVGRNAAAARQLASRARRRVQGSTDVGDVDLAHKREVVEAFLAASRNGDFEGLLAVLDPDVVVRADAEAIRTGAQAEVRGAAEVAKTFAGRARAARSALIDGTPGLVWASGGQPRVVFGITIVGRQIVEIELVADPTRLGEMELVFLDDH